MPSDILESRGVPTPSHFHEDISITPEVNSWVLCFQVFLKFYDTVLVLPLMHRHLCTTVFSWFFSRCFDVFVWQKQFGFMKTNQMAESGGDRCSSSWTSDSYQLTSQPSLSGALPSVIPNGRSAASDSHWESSLFSSSLSELFSRQCKPLIQFYKPF